MIRLTGRWSRGNLGHGGGGGIFFFLVSLYRRRTMMIGHYCYWYFVDFYCYCYFAAIECCVVFYIGRCIYTQKIVGVVFVLALQTQKRGEHKRQRTPPDFQVRGTYLIVLVLVPRTSICNFRSAYLMKRVIFQKPPTIFRV